MKRLLSNPILFTNNNLRRRKPTAIFSQKIETLHVGGFNNGMWWT